MSRYQCVECGREETGETDCLKHALKYGHKEFLDSEGSIYCPLDDPDILDE